MGLGLEVPPGLGGGAVAGPPALLLIDTFQLAGGLECLWCEPELGQFSGSTLSYNVIR